jgi:hypothetical protein
VLAGIAHHTDSKANHLFVAHLLAMWAAVGDGHPLAWVDLCVIAACAAVLGFDGEIRRTGGFDLK